MSMIYDNKHVATQPVFDALDALYHKSAINVGQVVSTQNAIDAIALALNNDLPPVMVASILAHTAARILTYAGIDCAEQTLADAAYSFKMICCEHNCLPGDCKCAVDLLALGM